MLLFFRKGFIPRASGDFGDGGAFPEIHVAQYPMDLGRPEPASAGAGRKSNALAVQLDATGKVKYDLIARQGTPRTGWSTQSSRTCCPRRSPTRTRRRCRSPGRSRCDSKSPGDSRAIFLGPWPLHFRYSIYCL